MEKEKFLQMLQETEIRNEILRIVKEGKNYIFNELSDDETAKEFKTENESVTSTTNADKESLHGAEGSEKEKIRILENENNKLKKEIGEMQDKLRQAQDKFLDAKNQIQTIDNELQDCRNKIINLKGKLNESEQCADNLQMERKKWKSDYQTEKRKSDILSSKYQNDINTLKQENQRLEQRKNSLEKANKSLQFQIEQRFARGWELFEAYQNVGDHTKQILHNGVFTQETNFMSFICGGAQKSSLEKLWDALKECIMRGQKKDAEILWDIFEYSIELVNSSKTQAKYEILTVNEGDRFDSDIHTEGSDSLAQGKVINVYLPGYKNTYDEKIIKKSIVQVG